MADFVLPSLGADMAAATLVEWKIRPGDTVTRGQVVADVETDKGVIEVECFNPGTVERLVVEPGQKLPVGALLAVIRGAGDVAAAAPSAAAVPPAPSGPTPAAPTPAAPTPAAPTPAAPTPAAPTPPAPTPASPAAPSAHRPKATPAARKRAAEAGVDLAQVRGSGPEGAIELADVERFAATTPATTPPTATPTTATPPPADDGRDRMRRAIAAAMSKSKREIPHYYLAATVDMSRALAWTESENQKRSIGDRILPAVLLIKAAALALAESPQLNGSYLDGRFRPADGVHLGLAIAMKGGGLVAPALHHADRLTLDELMIALHDLIPRARTGRLRSSEMTDSTATLTNLGDLGVETVYGAIYPPQVALVGLGKIARRPWVDGDTVCVRPLLTATLAADHRATDGRYGARFLELFDRRLQKPEEL